MDSETYKQCVNRNRNKLLRSIDPTDVVIDSLSLIPLLDGKLDGIKSQPTTTINKALLILKLPIGENSDTIKSFLSVLYDNDHRHVADVFMKKSSDHLMSDERHELLRKELPRLCKYLDPESGIIDELLGRGVFSWSDKERVETEKTWNKKVSKIVEILSRKLNSDFDQFIEGLTEVGQEHVVYVLLDTGSPPMNDTVLNRITRNRKKIIGCMDSDTVPLLSELVSRGVFTKYDEQRVEGRDEIRWQRNEEILKILERKPQSVFNDFLESLRKTDQEHVATLFGGLEVNALIHAEQANSIPVDERTEQMLVEAMQDLQNNQNDDENTLRKTLDDIGVEFTGAVIECIKVKFTLFNASSVKQLKDLIRRGKLGRLFTERYCPRLVHKGLHAIRVAITDDEFERCSKQMERLALMTPEHENALERAKKEIADIVEVNEELLKRLSLCKYRKQTILGSKDKVRALMDVMARRPDCEFQELLDAFRDTGQTEAVQFLTGFYSAMSLRCRTIHKHNKQNVQHQNVYDFVIAFDIL